MRIKLITILIVSLLISGCTAITIPTAMAKEITPDYGEYPSNYKEIVKNWINETFFDPSDVRILEISKPKKFRLPTTRSSESYTYGYRVSVTFLTKNQIQIGKKTICLFIFKGKLLKQWKSGTIPSLFDLP